MARRTGIQVRERDRESFLAAISTRTAALHVPGPDEYYALLQENSPRADEEWNQLLDLVTNNESYFFRDQGQIALLRDQLLPELIRRNAARGSRSLRIWSAGCSTGEEPYSLAILLDGLLPDRSDWTIRILGSDLSDQALRQARRGHYRDWSFRMVEPAIRHRYFHPQRGGYEIDETIRSMVRFRMVNLPTDPFPSGVMDIHQMDLILCRNVFIYLSDAAVEATLEKFTRSLAPGGYLMTGHAELLGVRLHGLEPRTLPGSLVYERTEVPSPDAGSAADKTPPAGPPHPAHRGGRSPASHPPTAPPSRPAAGHSRAAPSRPRAAAHPRAPARHPAPTVEAPLAAPQPSLAAAEALADRGEYGEAADHCRAVLGSEPLNIDAYLLLASLCEEQGEVAAAADHFQRALYLEPESVEACLGLSHLYRRMGDANRAARLELLARDLVEKA